MAPLQPRWPDGQTGPGETPDRALLRRVKMHEFLMSGGVQISTNPVTYSEPLDPAFPETLPSECPWHPDYPNLAPCTAWEEIKAGRGSGEQPKERLAELRGRTPEELSEARDRVRIARNQQTGIFDPQFDESGADPRPVGAFAGAATLKPKKKTGGFPWDPKPSQEDARDTAFAELSAGFVPDEIEIDGDEDGED